MMYESFVYFIPLLNVIFYTFSFLFLLRFRRRCCFYQILFYFRLLFSSIQHVQETNQEKIGFLRQKSCIPGFYEGSCLIILPPETLHNAIETCQYDYGGRLATAPTNDAIQTWVRTIHFNTDFPFNKDSRFWIGYGRSGFQDIGSHVSNFVNESFWDHVFEPHSFSSTVEFESNENYDLLDDSECPNVGTVFNPVNKKFSVKRSNEIYYSLCEAPRWAKLQCDTGWYLIPQIRMCVNVHQERAKFLHAHSVCNREGSFIATAQGGKEVAMLRNVIVPFNIHNDFFHGGGFWVGVKSFGTTTFSMDGTEPFITVQGAGPEEKYCVGLCYKDFYDTELQMIGAGTAVPCEDIFFHRTFYLPYMCQRFADQSLSTNV